jgi:putative salt-induced outer membrane protein YdiY
MKRTACVIALMAGSLAGAQDDPAVTSAAALLEQLKAAGVEIPEGFVVNEDGSVSLPVAEDAAATVESAGEAPSPAVADAPSVEELKKPEWDTKLNIGINVASGNTEQIGAATTIVSTRTTDATALRLDAGYFYASQDGDKTANRFTAGVNNDWLMPDSRWLFFAGGRYDWDEFRSFDHRISANGGVGYELIKRDTMQLTLRAGAGFFQEYGSGRNEIVPEGLLGADFNWDMAENQSFQVSTRIFPDLSDGGEFRTFTTAGWKLDIDKDDGLSFSINAIHEYISNVDPGIEKADLQLFAGLTYDF